MSPSAASPNIASAASDDFENSSLRHNSERSLLLRQLAEQSRLLDQSKNSAEHFARQAQALIGASADLILRVAKNGQTLEMLGDRSGLSERLTAMLSEVRRLPPSVLAARQMVIDGALRSGDLRTHVMHLPGGFGQPEQVFEERLFPLSETELLAVLRDVSGSAGPADADSARPASMISPHSGLPNELALAQFVDTQIAAGQAVGLIALDWRGARTQALAAGLLSPASLLAPVHKDVKSLLKAPEALYAIGLTRYVIGLSAANLDALKTRGNALMQLVAQPQGQAAQARPAWLEPAACMMTVPENGASGPELLAGAAQRLAASGQSAQEKQASIAAPALSLGQVAAALKAGQLVARFQPIFGLSSGGQRFSPPLAVEVLAALRGADGKVRLPGEFFATVEASPLLHELGYQVVWLGLQQIPAWGNKIHPTTRVAVNMTLAQLANPALPERIAQCCENFKVDASRLLIDINESHLPFDTESLMLNGQALHARGARFVLDDFGQAPIRPDWFDTLPITAVKLSRKLVNGLGVTPAAAVRMRGLIQLAKSYNFSVLACGVETEDQAIRLWEAGVVGAQGNLWAGATDGDSLALG